jgi:Lantibiotic biosynthesis dehydratase C-term
VTWLSAHVFRHDDLDTLLTEQIGPLGAELTADRLIQRFFYLRYWEGGPHVRVRMRTTDVGRLRSILTERLGGYLRAHPSRHPVGQSAYAAWSEHYAKIEGRRYYDRLLYAADTIIFRDYVPESDSFGHGRALHAVENNFCDSTEIALQTLNMPPQRRLSPAMAMTLATMISLPPTRVRDVPYDADTDSAWLKSRDELLSLAERLRTADLSTESDVPVLDWLRSLLELRDLLTALHADGVFVTSSKRPVAYAIHRCLHLHLNRMGVTADQETRLRRLAQRTVASNSSR